MDKKKKQKIALMIEGGGTKRKGRDLIDLSQTKEKWLNRPLPDKRLFN